MKRFAVLALAIAVAGGCSSTEKKPAPSPAPVQTAAGTSNASNVQQAGTVVPQRSTGTTGTGSYLISGPRPATGGSDCNH